MNRSKLVRINPDYLYKAEEEEKLSAQIAVQRDYETILKIERKKK